MDVLLDLAKLVVGALLGYWLGQRGADRQFQRQQVRQRVSDASKAYVDCLKAGRRLVGELYLPRNQLPWDLLTDAVRDKVAGLQEQLADAEIALGVHGATATIGQLQEVRLAALSLLGFPGILTALVTQGSHSESQTYESYMAAWLDMAQSMENAEREWEKWKADQEAVAGRWDWLRRVRNWAVWARVRALAARTYARITGGTAD